MMNLKIFLKIKAKTQVSGSTEWKHGNEKMVLHTKDTIGQTGRIVIIINREKIMDIKILRNQLDKYKNNIVSREELIGWAYNALNSMIQSKEVLSLEGIFTYPFISKISVNKNSWESIKDNTIDEYISILNGEKEYHYLFITKLEEKKWIEQLAVIEKMLDNYIINNSLAESEYDYLIDFVEKEQGGECKTISDLVMSNIIDYIDGLPINIHNELELSSLYVHYAIKNSVEYIKLINNMIKVYCGRLNLCVNINYSKFGNTITLNPLLS